MAIELTREEWAKIHRDYKGRLQDGTRCAFAGSLPNRVQIPESGTTIVPVKVVSRLSEPLSAVEG